MTRPRWSNEIEERGSHEFMHEAVSPCALMNGHPDPPLGNSGGARQVELPQIDRSRLVDPLITRLLDEPSVLGEQAVLIIEAAAAVILWEGWSCRGSGMALGGLDARRQPTQ
jgi:hypothetical protein